MGSHDDPRPRGPSYDAETLATYFRPMDESLYDHPVAGSALRQLASSDAHIIAAVADVDRSQIRRALAKLPAERLKVATGIAKGLRAFRRVI